jgi:hypothetical protein
MLSVILLKVVQAHVVAPNPDLNWRDLFHLLLIIPETLRQLLIERVDLVQMLLKLFFSFVIDAPAAGKPFAACGMYYKCFTILIYECNL